MPHIERLLRNRGFGFTQHQAGFFQLNKPSASAHRSDGTPHRDPLPGLISPQTQERILKYSRNEEEAVAQFIAVATQQVTDPVLADEPVSAPPMSMETIERVTATIVENKLSGMMETMRAENAKHLEAVTSKVLARLDALVPKPAPAAPAPTARQQTKPGKGKRKKGSWRNQPAPAAPAPAIGRPPEPPIDMGIG